MSNLFITPEGKLIVQTIIFPMYAVIQGCEEWGGYIIFNV